MKLIIEYAHKKQWQALYDTLLSPHQEYKQEDLDTTLSLIAQVHPKQVRKSSITEVLENISLNNNPNTVDAYDVIVESAKILIQKGANPSFKNEAGQSLVHLSIAHVYINLALEMMKSPKFQPNLADNDGKTPLHLAASLEKLDLIVMLTNLKANVNAADNDGYTPLHNAINEGNLEITKYLIKNGADINRKPAKNHADTPLNVAAHKGHFNIAVLLLALGADSKGITTRNEELAKILVTSNPKQAAINWIKEYNWDIASKLEPINKSPEIEKKVNATWTDSVQRSRSCSSSKITLNKSQIIRNTVEQVNDVYDDILRSSTKYFWTGNDAIDQILKDDIKDRLAKQVSESKDRGIA
ncbi:MAG: ankyrin repeat domain-containing protein [Alphaproteobacteria bacterium]|nr:ankyrin repeat domain-containing protein [Alphaproteobacteria bacterium]OJV13148.1 MAG: hypothetical protein BGO27_02870 [Alphaproteobacteria bacterium 33-17]